MAILKIARMGHPALARRADPVADPTAPEIAALVADMIETMRDAPGVGLAAPQVHIPLRLVIFQPPEQPLTVLANPEIVPLTGETELGWEGCLSVPGLRGLVPRRTAIRYSGFGLDGSRIEREATGMHARVVQHECDHLDGVLYPQRIADLGDLIFESELRHRLRDEPVMED